ncbi:hypothetical protein CVT26_013918 [Gymnopilus dilepis]|uniref:Amino acid permease/ SLC12A domain-containing protein n=1 Tax=Gymnopilus dilepis TaxID=231916 RepID=A0A409VW42_9AGAR|nr:hypothetical protein CVT26_013918 [Gymnopilus dilepis]
MSNDRLEKPAKSQDEELLAFLGYKQELKRDFSCEDRSVLVYSLPNGGAVAMWTVCCFFFMAIACSLGELASSAPTSGGLYYWSFHFSSNKYQRFLSWTVGYVNNIGWISGFTGLDFATSLQIFAGVTIGSGGTFVPTNGQIYGLFCALVVFHAMLASLATRFLARLQPFYLAMNILVFVVLIIALPIATPAEFKNSASYAFGNFENLTLWPNGFAFCLSFLAPTWTMGGIDAPVHISEEARNASVAVPRTIIMSTALGCILGWALNVAIAFNMGTDIANILSNPIGQPMATIILNSLGQKGTLAVWCFIIVIMNMASMDILVASSRQTFAFSRDGALPFSKYLYKINKTTGTPVLCVIFCAAISMLLGLLSFAGTAAIGALFSLGIVCQYTAYMIPILARQVGKRQFRPGPYSLGKLSSVVSYTAVAFMAFIIIILLFPLNPDPTAAEMNYSIVVVGGILTLSTVYYFLPVYGGRHWFSGPVRNVDGVPSREEDEKQSFEKGEVEVVVNDNN